MSAPGSTGDDGSRPGEAPEPETGEATSATLDLRDRPVAPSGAAEAGKRYMMEELPPPSPELPREWKTKSRNLNDRRFTITCVLLVTVAVIAFVALASSYFLDSQEDEEDLRDLMSIIFGPLVALLGTSFAWFFARGESRP